MRDQDAALLNVAKHLGMMINKHEHTGKDGAPIPGTPENPVHVAHELSPDAIASFISDLRRAGIGDEGLEVLGRIPPDGDRKPVDPKVPLAKTD